MEGLGGSKGLAWMLGCVHHRHNEASLLLLLLLLDLPPDEHPSCGTLARDVRAAAAPCQEYIYIFPGIWLQDSAIVRRTATGSEMTNDGEVLVVCVDTKPVLGRVGVCTDHAAWSHALCRSCWVLDVLLWLLDSQMVLCSRQLITLPLCYRPHSTLRLQLPAWVGVIESGEPGFQVRVSTSRHGKGNLVRLSHSLCQSSRTAVHSAI